MPLNISAMQSLSLDFLSPPLVVTLYLKSSEVETQPPLI